VAGKLLWIQDLVQSGQSMLVQIPTVWNVSDIGTKPLSTKRIKVLVHELGMCENEGAYAVGQAETEEQAARHGGSKGFTLLAKNVKGSYDVGPWANWCVCETYLPCLYSSSNSIYSVVRNIST